MHPDGKPARITNYTTRGEAGLPVGRAVPAPGTTLPPPVACASSAIGRQYQKIQRQKALLEQAVELMKRPVSPTEESARALRQAIEEERDRP